MYLFPFSKIKPGSDIVIYGAGNVGLHYIKQIEMTCYCNIMAVADKNRSGDAFGNGCKIISPDDVQYKLSDAVVIAVEDSNVTDSIRSFLLEKGAENIVWDIMIYDGPDHFSHQKEYMTFSAYDTLPYSKKLMPDELNSLKELLGVLKIRTYDGIKLIRVGSCSDGGYLMDETLNGSIAYSIGIGDEISWDDDMASRGYDLFMYDFTVDKLPFDNERFHFFQKGITGRKTDDHRFLTLEEAIGSNGHEKESGTILKMDIEGAEWVFYETVGENLLSGFDQLVFETHGLLNVDRWKYFADCLKRLERTHTLVHVHANNYSKYALIDGLRLADCMELTYVKNDGKTFKHDEAVLPRSLDYPNIPGLDETDLRNWNTLIDKIITN